MIFFLNQLIFSYFFYSLQGNGQQLAQTLIGLFKLVSDVLFLALLTSFLFKNFKQNEYLKHLLRASDMTLYILTPFDIFQ